MKTIRAGRRSFLRPLLSILLVAAMPTLASMFFQATESAGSAGAAAAVKEKYPLRSLSESPESARELAVREGAGFPEDFVFQTVVWKSLRAEWSLAYQYFKGYMERARRELDKLDVATIRRYGRKIVGKADSNLIFDTGLYNLVIAANRGRFDTLTVDFIQFRDANSLDLNGLLRLALAFIQTMKYEIPEDHPYQVYAPAEVAGLVRGDCDSKAMAAALLLAGLGYDCVLLVSDYYVHAMLGVAVPSEGTSLVHADTAYAVVEVTASGWAVGELPPSCADISQWRVVPLPVLREKKECLVNDIFSPFRLGPLELVNRLARSATHARMAGPDGEMTAAEVELYRRLSAGGTGLIMSGHMYVRRDGKCSINMLGIDSDERIAGLARAAEAVHAAGPARLLGQINFGGAQVPKAIRPAVLLAPSSREDVPEAREASDGELEELAAAYGRASFRLRQAGFDGVQLHCAHGYFINQTLSPLFNRRTDRFGGSPEGRLLFLQLAIAEVRRAAGSDFPLILKLASSDGFAGGLVLADTIEIARRATGSGVIALELSGGAASAMNARRTGGKADPAWPFSEGYFADAAAAFKKALAGPIISVGGYRSLALMREVVASGKADVVALSRPLIREPDLPKKMAGGSASRAACTSCNLCQEHNAEALRCWAVQF